MPEANDDHVPTTIIVGASSGIGRSLAYAYARDRHRVALIGRNLETLNQVAKHVSAFGGTPLALASDVRDPASIRTALDRIIEEWGQIDTAILSSGIALATDMEHFAAGPVEEIIQTNVIGVAHWLEALQPVLKGTGAKVAVISSLSADRALPGTGAGYSASKASISQLLDGMREAWRRQDIHLVTVSPGFIRTAMTDGMSFMPLLMEPEDAATVIINGLKNNKSIIRFPALGSLAMGAIRLLPAVLLDKLYRG